MEETNEIKAARKHFSKLGLMFLLGTIIIKVVQNVLAALVQNLHPEWLQNINIAMALSTVTMYLVGMPALILLVKRVPAVQVERHRMKFSHFILAAIMSYAFMYISNIIGNIFTFSIGALRDNAVENVAASVISSVSPIWLFLYAVICAPFMEEYVFRKLIVDRTVRYGQGVAVIMSGLMFGLFHGNLNQFAYAFTLGTFLAFLYVKTGDLRWTIGIHMLINFMGGIVSALVLGQLDLDEYQQIAARMDLDAMTEYMGRNFLGIMMLMALFAFIFSMVIAGGILFIVAWAKNRFALASGEVVIPKGKRFQTVVLNVGMLSFFLLWILTIVMQLFE